MGKVVRLMDRDLEAIFDRIEEVKKRKVAFITTVVGLEDGSQEFFFYGNPIEVYQSLTLAAGHILQNFPLMDDKLEEE